MLKICYSDVPFSKLVDKIQGLFKHFQRPWILQLNSNTLRITQARYELLWTLYLSRMGNEYQPKFSDTLQLGSKGRYGLFYLHACVGDR